MTGEFMKVVAGWKYLSAIILAVLLSGCATKNIQPYDGGSDGLVIIAMDVSAAPSHDIWYDYLFTVKNLETKDEHRMRVAPRIGDTYEFLGQLPEGLYVITKRVSLAKNGRRVYPRTMTKRFEVEAGKVTLPFKLIVSSHDNAQYLDITFLSKTEAATLFENELQPRADLNGWTLK